METLRTSSLIPLRLALTFLNFPTLDPRQNYYVDMSRTLKCRHVADLVYPNGTMTLV